MILEEVEHLNDRIMSGERPTTELLRIREGSVPKDDEQFVQALSDLWNNTLRIDGLYPKLDAAKAIIDIAWAGDSSYPVHTSEGLIYDSLTRDEREVLFAYIANCIGEERASVAGSALAEFADDLLGDGPTV